MQDKNFSIDDILDEVNTNKLPPEQLDEIVNEYQKFDTNALLDEILHPNNNDTAFAIDEEKILKSVNEVLPDDNISDKDNETKAKTVVKNDEQKDDVMPEEQPTNDKIFHQKTRTVETSYEKTKISQTDQPIFKKETIKPTADGKIDDSQSKKKKIDNPERQKYLDLHNNRSRVIEDFVLTPNFATDSHNLTKEAIEEAKKEAEVSKQNDVDSQEIKEKTNVFDKADEIKVQSQISKISFEPKANESSIDIDIDKVEFSPKSDTKDFLQGLKDKRKFILIRMYVVIALFIVMGIITIFNTLSENPLTIFDKEQNPLSFVMINLFSLILGGAMVYDVLSEGLLAVLNQKINKSTIFSIATILLLVFNITMVFQSEQVAQSEVHLYVPFLLLNYIAVMIAKRQEIKRIIKNFNFVSSNIDKYSVNVVENEHLAEDFTKGAVKSYPHFAVNTKTAFLKNFMTESFSEDLNDKKAKYVLPIVIGLGILITIISFIMEFSSAQIFTLLTGVLVCGASGYTFLMISDPLELCCEEVTKLGGAVLSYGAVEEFANVNSTLINANNLFETGDVILYGIKTFPNIVIDRAILDATSVLCKTHSILSGTFMNIIEDRKDFLAEVDNIIYEDGMGISAWVDDRRVLIGSRELMKNHNVDTPSRDYENKYLSQDKNLIYLSTGGELSAVFIVGLKCNPKIRNMLVDLYNNDCVCVIKTVDPILTKSQFAKVFDMPEDAFKIISSRLHKDSDELTNTNISKSAKVCNNGNIFAYIYSLLWAKRLNKIISIGEMLSFIMIGVNIALFFVFTFLNSSGQLDNRFLCIYQIIAIFVCVVLQRLNKVK